MIVREHSQQRAAIRGLWELLSEAYRPPLPGMVWRDQAAAKMNDLAQSSARSTAQSVGDALAEGMAKLDAAPRREGQITGLSTGLVEVDKSTGGLHAPEITLVCGVEKRGKSSLAHSIAVNVASNWTLERDHVGAEVRVPNGVVIYCLDSMKKQEIAMRMAYARGRVDSVKIRNGSADADDLRRLVQAQVDISALPILIDDETTLTPLALRQKLRAAVVELRKKWGARLRLVVIDYVQLLGCDGDVEKLNDEQKLNRIGKSLLRTAESFDVPMLLLSQLNAAGDTRDAKALQQHMQNKWKVDWKPAARRPHIPGVLPRPEPHNATIMIELTRNGRPGPCPTKFHQTYTLYSDEEQ